MEDEILFGTFDGIGNLQKGTRIVDGKTIEISNLIPNYNYKEGQLKVAYYYNTEDNWYQVVSPFVDVPAFKTKPVPISNLRWRSNGSKEKSETYYLDNGEKYTFQAIYDFDKKYELSLGSARGKVESSDPTIAELVSFDSGIYNDDLKDLAQLSLNIYKPGTVTLTLKEVVGDTENSVLTATVTVEQSEPEEEPEPEA